jgi:O-antigen/teichoic acid export membrane protein
MNKIYRRLGEGIAQTAGGYLSINGGLTVGNLFGSVINFFVGFTKARSLGFFRLFSLKKGLLVSLFKRYSHFPKYALASNVFSNLCAVIPFAIISNQFDTYHTGIFGLSRMLIFTPISIISISIGQVLFQRFTSKNQRGESVLRDVLIVSGFLALSAAIITLLVFPWSNEIISFLFGKEWSQSGKLFSIMLIGFIFQFSVSPVSVALVVYEKLNIQTVWQTFYLLALASLFLFAYSYLDRFVWRMVIVDSVCYLLYFGFIVFVAYKAHLKIISVNQKKI